MSQYVKVFDSVWNEVFEIDTFQIETDLLVVWMFGTKVLDNFNISCTIASLNFRASLLACELIGVVSCKKLS